MRYTFKPDDCMVITIPLASVRNAREGQLMPDKFTCRFKDSYKVYQRGRPKALGVAQIITAVFILCLGGISINLYGRHLYFMTFVCMFMIPTILYLVSGALTIASANTPLMPLMKVSFAFNILGLCFAIIMTCLISLVGIGPYGYEDRSMRIGLSVMIAVLNMFEFLLSVILIHWESKALCRTHFNSLPMITLKQDM